MEGINIRIIERKYAGEVIDGIINCNVSSAIVEKSILALEGEME